VPRESSLLDLVHSDICGPMPHQSLSGASYFVTFIDNATRKVWAYPTRTKDCVFTIFKDWLAMVENQTDRKLKCL
jgi:5'-3' exoribonuclease 2